MRKPKGSPLTKLQVEILKEEGLMKEDGTLSPKGELTLHQLTILDHWFRVAVPRRAKGKKVKVDGPCKGVSADLLIVDDPQSPVMEPTPVEKVRFELITWLNTLSELDFANFRQLLTLPHSIPKLPEGEYKRMAMLALELQKVDGA